ncbi:hypothetical protein B0T10DRAFT_469733, partial [Thelonectria olida]
MHHLAKRERDGWSLGKTGGRESYARESGRLFAPNSKRQTRKMHPFPNVVSAGVRGGRRRSHAGVDRNQCCIAYPFDVNKVGAGQVRKCCTLRMAETHSTASRRKKKREKRGGAMEPSCCLNQSVCFFVASFWQTQILFIFYLFLLLLSHLAPPRTPSGTWEKCERRLLRFGRCKRGARVRLSQCHGIVTGP